MLDAPDLSVQLSQMIGYPQFIQYHLGCILYSHASQIVRQQKDSQSFYSLHSDQIIHMTTFQDYVISTDRSTVQINANFIQMFIIHSDTVIDYINRCGYLSSNSNLQFRMAFMIEQNKVVLVMTDHKDSDYIVIYDRELEMCQSYYHYKTRIMDVMVLDHEQL